MRPSPGEPDKTYTLKLTVTNSAGQTGETTQPVTVTGGTEPGTEGTEPGTGGSEPGTGTGGAGRTLSRGPAALSRGPAAPSRGPAALTQGAASPASSGMETNA